MYRKTTLAYSYGSYMLIINNARLISGLRKENNSRIYIKSDMDKHTRFNTVSVKLKRFL